jgi:hypothetical protein
MATQELPPPLALFRMVTGYYVSQATYAVAKLGIADLLADGPRPHGELAKATATDADALRRVLRLLSSVGVFAEEAGGRFEGVYPPRIDQSDVSRGAAANDVNMLVCTGGRQRSEAEFRALYEAAGLKLTRIIPTEARVGLIEGVPV